MCTMSSINRFPISIGAEPFLIAPNAHPYMCPGLPSLIDSVSVYRTSSGAYLRA